jgi:lactocepin
MSGKISASLGTGKKIPTCTVSASIGQKFVQNGSGTISLNEEYKAGPFMSSFSSWGPTPDLKLKPEITAHGGDILSAVPGGGYEEQSGTSMATPNMAGAVALLRQHIEQTGEFNHLSGVEKTKAITARVNQLLMSTATIAKNDEGNPYSPRKQGAGLASILKATTAEGYITVKNKGVISDKTKIELGDDEEKTGVYTMSFNLTNFGEANSKRRTLKVTIPEELDYNELFDDLFAKYTNRAVLVKVKLKNLGTLFQLTYDITLKNVKEEKTFIDELRVRNANLDILCSRVITGSDEL